MAKDDPNDPKSQGSSLDISSVPAAKPAPGGDSALTVGARATPDQNFTPDSDKAPAQDAQNPFSEREIKAMASHQMSSVMMALLQKDKFDGMCNALKEADKGNFEALNQQGILINNAQDYQKYFPVDPPKFNAEGGADQAAILGDLLHYFIDVQMDIYGKIKAKEGISVDEAGTKRADQRGALVKALQAIDAEGPKTFTQFRALWDEYNQNRDLMPAVHALALIAKQKEEYVMHAFAIGPHKGASFLTSSYLEEGINDGKPKVLKVIDYIMTQDEVKNIVQSGDAKVNHKGKEVDNEFAKLRFRIKVGEKFEEYGFHLEAETVDTIHGEKTYLVEYKVPIVNGEPNLKAKSKINGADRALAEVTGDYKDSGSLAQAVIDCYSKQDKAIREALDPNANKKQGVPVKATTPSAPPPAPTPPPLPPSGSGNKPPLKPTGSTAKKNYGNLLMLPAEVRERYHLNKPMLEQLLVQLNTGRRAPGVDTSGAGTGQAASAAIGSADQKDYQALGDLLLDLKAKLDEGKGLREALNEPAPGQSGKTLDQAIFKAREERTLMGEKKDNLHKKLEENKENDVGLPPKQNKNNLSM